MKKTFKAENISCGKCANLIKVSLEDDFGEIEVDLNKEPKEVRVEIPNLAKEELFKVEMEDIGFPIIEE